DNKRMLRRRIAAPLAIRHGGHGWHADFFQARNGFPFLARAQHRQFGSNQILGDFAPADAAMDLDEIPAPLNFGAQGAPTFEFAIHLTVQTLDFGERIASGPKRLEWFSKEQLHG